MPEIASRSHVEVISRLAEGASAGETAEGSNQSSGLGSLWQQITANVQQNGQNSQNGQNGTYMPSLWYQTMQGVEDNSSHYTDYYESHDYGDNGIGVGGWIILIIIVMIIFSQSHPVRKAKRSYRKSGGSKPLGWIGALIGLSVLSKLFRK